MSLPAGDTPIPYGDGEKPSPSPPGDGLGPAGERVGGSAGDGNGWWELRGVRDNCPAAEYDDGSVWWNNEPGPLRAAVAGGDGADRSP